jgi:hypothetical protein
MPEVNDVLNHRQDEYGDAHTNFTTIGKIWGALLDIDPIEPYQVALMMDALKTVRLFKNARHEDSWVDKHGYIHHAQEIAFYES